MSYNTFSILLILLLLIYLISAILLYRKEKKSQWKGVIISKKKKTLVWKLIEDFIWEGGAHWRYDRYVFRYTRDDGKVKHFYTHNPSLYNDLEVGDEIIKRKDHFEPEKMR